MTGSVVLWVLAILAVYRLTRLVTADRVLQGVRDRLEARSDLLGYLAHCDWCVSWWVSWPVVAMVVWHGDRVWVWWVVGALAASAVAGLVAQVERRITPSEEI